MTAIFIAAFICTLLGWLSYMDYKGNLDKCKHTYELYEKIIIKSYSDNMGFKYVSRCSKCGDITTKRVDS